MSFQFIISLSLKSTKIFFLNCFFIFIILPYAFTTDPIVRILRNYFFLFMNLTEWDFLFHLLHLLIKKISLPNFQNTYPFQIFKFILFIIVYLKKFKYLNVSVVYKRIEEWASKPIPWQGSVGESVWHS